jgi:2-polyprenyl-3-methyl-5-hydroxy-6-metoxy-1,4-benzoquinol methylase
MSEETVERVVPGTSSWDRFGQEHIQRYEFFKPFYQGKKVLDAACGTGYGSKFIIQNGASQVTGVDLSEEAVSFARLHYSQDRLQYLVQDCTKLQSLKDKFDLVVSFETIEHLPDPEQFIASIRQLLPENGIFICSTPNKSRLSGAGNINPYHPNELYLEDFMKIFKKYFKVEQSYHQSESVNYLRYMELKYQLHQLESQTKAYLFSRFELKMRKLFRKPFQPTNFMHEHLADQFPGDMVIEPLVQERNWHKTFVIVGRNNPGQGA